MRLDRENRLVFDAYTCPRLTDKQFGGCWWVTNGQLKSISDSKPAVVCPMCSYCQPICRCQDTTVQRWLACIGKTEREFGEAPSRDDVCEYMRADVPRVVTNGVC